MDDRRTIDLDKYIRTKVRVLNDTGARGFDRGVRTFNCPLCRDTKGRGWLNIAFWTAGCFNIGCDACDRLQYGALEWARRQESIRSRAETMSFLRQRYGTTRVIEYRALPREGDDFVRWPESVRWFKPSMDPMQRTYQRFVEKQWSIGLADMIAWGLGYCVVGFYAQRVIIPIVMDGKPVAFQARTISDAPTKSKYLTSRHGPKDDLKAECFRPASAILFNYDRIVEGGSAVLVEGVGDVMGWHRGNMGRQPTASAMLGVSITPEKLALLAAKNLDKIILAPDAEPQAQKQADDLYSLLLDNDFPVALGTWVGGKDAGSGARLEEKPSTLRDSDLRLLSR